MIVIGHRGCAQQYPENTVEAVRQCSSHVDMIEIDVLRCASGELIAFHDESLERVTGVDASIKETDWKTIRTLEVFDTGANVARLADILEAWPDGVGLNLDIHEPGIAPEALSLATERVEDILLSTTNTAVLEECENSQVAAKSGFSFYENAASNVSRAESRGCEFVHLPYQLCLETDIVSLAHETGLSVDAWTVASADVFEQLQEAGVDAVTVDRWDILE